MFDVVMTQLTSSAEHTSNPPPSHPNPNTVEVFHPPLPHWFLLPVLPLSLSDTHERFRLLLFRLGSAEPGLFSSPRSALGLGSVSQPR